MPEIFTKFHPTVSGKLLNIMVNGTERGKKSKAILGTFSNKSTVC
jgi:hypothetical protein